jgi:hypothetical protein
MSSCINQECNWLWVDKIPDVYVPVQKYNGGYVDISLWVCGSCGDVKAEVD